MSKETCGSCTHYICKYTPVELMRAIGGDTDNYNAMPEGFDLADQIISPNICGFGKTLIEGIWGGHIKELVLVNCCDSIRSVYDILEAYGKLDFVHLIDVSHCKEACSREMLTMELVRFAKAYGEYKGVEGIDIDKFLGVFDDPELNTDPYIGVLGARMGDQLFQMVSKTMPLKVRNLTCVNNRSVPKMRGTAGGGFVRFDDDEFASLMAEYAANILTQVPCMRMSDATGRHSLVSDPNLKGIVYHTVKFCDYYSFEYADLKNQKQLPLVKIESDYTVSAIGQLMTRLEAFAETIELDLDNGGKKKNTMGKGYFAGVDSGSTSTDVVIMDRDKNIVTDIIIPTGAGAALSAEKAIAMALESAGLQPEDVDAVVTTGYGRSAIDAGDKSITEITCHARGAHYLAPEVRTVVDIGGQDSKVIKLDEQGNVLNFVMNDKCAAGTGRFLEMMARSMEMSLEGIASRGFTYDEDITISSMCTVFAESEIVSLVAQNKSIDDIVHGINKSVAVKTAALVTRVGGEEKYMMTGGVSKNASLVKTLGEKLGTDLIVSEKAQLAGAIGAALFAMEL